MSLKKEDLKEGEIYIYDNKHISRYPRGASVNRNEDRMQKQHPWIWILEITNATPEEKHWLLECEKVGRFIPKEEALKTFKKEIEFQPGKWYYHEAHGSKNYTKLSQIEHNHFKSKDWLVKGSTNDGYEFTSGAVWHKDVLDSIREASLEEIQEYLPDNHPDKFKKEEEKKYDYKVVHCKTQEQWDFVYEKVNSRQSNNWNSYKENTGFAFNVDEYSSISFYETRSSLIYSFEDWCTKFGHTFEKKEEIPEYVECIEEYNYFIVNNIYKKIREGWFIKQDIKELPCSQTGEYFFRHFKPSTKEAYEAQFKKAEIKEEKWIPKVGDWVLLSNTANGWGCGPWCRNAIVVIASVDDDRVYEKAISFKRGDETGRTILKEIVRKALPHEIPVGGNIYNYENLKENNYLVGVDPYNGDYTKWSKEDLLEKAIRDYPIGTVFQNCLVKHQGKAINDKGKIDGGYNFVFTDNFTTDIRVGIYYGNEWVMINNLWADVISRPEEKQQFESISKVESKLHKELINKEPTKKIKAELIPVKNLTII